MNRTIFATFIAVIFLVACNSKVDDKLVQEMIKSIDQNNEQLNEYSKSIERDFEIKSTKIEYSDKANYYLAKMKKSDSLLKNLIITFEELNKKAEINSNNLNNPFIRYKSDLSQIDSAFKGQIKDIDSFENYNTSSKKLLLAFYKNKAVLMNNIFIQFCEKQVCFIPIIFD